jgi:hypothetical protein
MVIFRFTAVMPGFTVMTLVCFMMRLSVSMFFVRMCRLRTCQAKAKACQQRNGQ